MGGYLSRRIEKGEKELRFKEDERKNAEDLIRLVPNPAKAIEDLRAEQKKLKEKSVSKRELTKIIQELVNKSNELGIEIISIRPKEDLSGENEKFPAGISKAYIEMTIMCSYSMLGEYLGQLGGSEILFTLEHIRVKSAERFSKTKKTQKGEEGDIIATMTLSTYAFVK